MNFHTLFAYILICFISVNIAQELKTDLKNALETENFSSIAKIIKSNAQLATENNFLTLLTKHPNKIKENIEYEVLHSQEYKNGNCYTLDNYTYRNTHALTAYHTALNCFCKHIDLSAFFLKYEGTKDRLHKQFLGVYNHELSACSDCCIIFYNNHYSFNALMPYTQNLYTVFETNDLHKHYFQGQDWLFYVYNYYEIVGKTLLHNACDIHDIQLIDFLCKDHNTNINAIEGRSKNTPLHSTLTKLSRRWLNEFRDPKNKIPSPDPISEKDTIFNIIKILCSYGANPLIENSTGHTPRKRLIKIVSDTSNGLALYKDSLALLFKYEQKWRNRPPITKNQNLGKPL